MRYDTADKAIRDMNRRNLRAFDRLKTLQFDQLNILRSVRKVYSDSVKLAKLWFLRIATDAYIEALVLAGIDRKEAEEKAEDDITEDWILDMFEEYDPVTLYQFLPEAERKKDRLVEALIASHNNNVEVDKALRLWTLQVTQYAEKSVDEATVDGYEDAGVKKVKWITERDEKVCSVCRERDGKIYPIDKIPPKPHYRCRCIWIPVTDEDNE